MTAPVDHILDTLALARGQWALCGERMPANDIHYGRRVELCGVCLEVRRARREAAAAQLGAS